MLREMIKRYRKKKYPDVSLSYAVSGYVRDVVLESLETVPDIRNVFLSKSPERPDIPGAGDVFVEVFPAAVGIGLHSVRNLWDENLHQRAQQEAVKCVDEVYAEPKFEYFREPFEARLYEYSKAWTDGEYPAMTFCMPFDNIVYVMLSNLEVKHLFLVEGANVISPTLTCGMVEVFTKLAVQNGFWKKTKSTCNLVV